MKSIRARLRRAPAPLRIAKRAPVIFVARSRSTSTLHHLEGIKLKRSRQPQKKQKKKSEGVRSEKRAAAVAKAIKFYRANEKPYGVLSNLYRSAVEFEGKLYPIQFAAASRFHRPSLEFWITRLRG